MQIFEDKERAKGFVKSFITIWMVFISLTPYFLVSFALDMFNTNLGLDLFIYLFDFLGASIFLLMISVFLRKQNLSTSRVKELIAANAKKVFFSGIIFFYLIIVVAIVINLNNLLSVLLAILPLIIFSFFAFPTLFFVLNVGKKNIEKINQAMDMGMPLENNTILLEDNTPLGSGNSPFFLRYWLNNKDGIKSAMEKTKLLFFPPYKKEAFSKAWNYNKKLDRYLGIIQNIFIITFVYRETIFSLFVTIAFLGLPIAIVLYFIKMVKAAKLNYMIYDLTKQGYIPKWIVLRRVIIYINSLLMSFSGFWIIGVIVISQITSNFNAPIIFSIILSLPWLLLEIINKKEYKYFKEYL